MAIIGIRYYGPEMRLQVMNDHTNVWVPVSWVDPDGPFDDEDPEIVQPTNPPEPEIYH